MAKGDADGQGKKGGSQRRAPLISGTNVFNVSITGANGTIDGQGDVWWYNKTKGDTPPHVIEFLNSSHVSISNVSIINSPFWTVHPVYVRGFVAHDLWILNPNNVSNTDGIDVDSSEDVLIHNAYIRTGDDGICIKSGWDEYGYTNQNSGVERSKQVLAFAENVTDAIKNQFAASSKV